MVRCAPRPARCRPECHVVETDLRQRDADHRCAALRQSNGRIAERGLARYPDFHLFDVPAAAAAAQLGRKQQAAGYVEALRRRLPSLDLDALGSRFKDPAYAAYLREGLKAAGL
jgi:hypothetical protein